MRLAILTSHPVQYYAPLFQELASRIGIHVFFAHRASAEQQGEAGFGKAFTWDIDFESGYDSSYLTNVAKQPHQSRFFGCDTPEIGDRLREGGFDAVLSLGWHLKSLIQGISAAKRQGLPVIVRGDSHLARTTSSIRRTVKAVAYPGLLRTFDAVCYVGERNKAYYRYYGYPEERMFHSPHAVDTQRFAAAATQRARRELRAELGLDESDRAVLLAGKLLPVKRPLDAVRAIALVREMGLRGHLVIAGSGPMEGDVRRLAKELAVPVRELGFVNQSHLPRVYAACDALVFPSSKEESWGLVCNEALASGLPVAVSEDVGCAADVCKNTVGARAFVGGDIASAAAVLKSLLTDPPAKEEIAATSDRFTLGKAANGIIEAMEAVVRH